MLCIFCADAKVVGVFSTGKNGMKWKLDNLKCHLNQKMHTNAIIKLRIMEKGGILNIFAKTDEQRKMKKKKLND